MSSESAIEAAARTFNVLMIYPRFAGGTFWNFAATCDVFGARYPAAPLGLITVAALLPPAWTVRLVNRNTEELADGDLAWADLVMTGGMLSQQHDTLEIITICHAHGKPVVVGGPGVTSSPHIYASADFRVLGEAEGIIDKFIAAWEAGATEGLFEAEKFTVDVTKSPIPRFDLLKFDQYLYVGVQFSRGCPFTCEFCDIIELYGRVPRAKTNAQMLTELEALYRLGYRGHVDFVDDNLIGNKKAVRSFLVDLRVWLDQHDYPFEFTTEASINLADDTALLQAMNEANFVGVFVGIESPDPDTLVETKKKQNTRRSLVDSVHKIYAAGLFVHAGFIVGFDSEKNAVADTMVAFIEDAAIPVCMVGLLYALPNTQLTRRLEREGRLYPEPDVIPKGNVDQCTHGLNFDTLRPKQAILLDYKRVLERVYDPVAFAGRLRRLAGLLDNSKRKRQTRADDARRKFSASEILHRILTNLPEPHAMFRQTLAECMSINPRSARWIMALMGLYLHLGPFSRYVVQQIELKIEEIERDGFDPRRAPVLPKSTMASPPDGSKADLTNLPPVPATPDRAAYRA
jgi:radical SAM superfamily enzyme YgiQ (UPF0313 family)